MTTTKGPLHTETQHSPPTQETSEASVPALGVDLMIFAHHLKDSGMSPARQAEYLQLYWDIACAFADIGHGLSPEQTACGKTPQSAEMTESLLQNMVLSEEFQSSHKEEVQS